MKSNRNRAVGQQGRHWRLAALSALAVMATGLAMHGPVRAADVGVSISVSQPGVYGRIDIGRFPQPQVVVAQPVIVRAPPPPPQVVVLAQAPAAQPVYLWVPPGHQKNWRKHCGRYNACGVPVYFVRDDWYQSNVMQPGHGGKGKHGHGQHGKGKHKDD